MLGQYYVAKNDPETGSLFYLNRNLSKFYGLQDPFFSGKIKDAELFGTKNGAETAAKEHGGDVFRVIQVSGSRIDSVKITHRQLEMF